jgi:predicted dehydrogenase
MDRKRPVTRRDFVKTTGGAAVGASLLPSLAGAASAAATAAGGKKRRYALIGTGDRGTTMWGKPVAQEYGDVLEFVGLCDMNAKRVEAGRKIIGVSCPTFTSFDEMCEKAKPDLLMVTTVDAHHAEYLVKAMDRGIDVMTEKPMVIDETQCQAVLDAEKRNNKKIVVTFNYRFAPKHRTIKETLMSGAIGKVLSVDFHWYLDTSHGADYFRRWHRLKEKSGSLWVHKATHHFDLINWWLDADPVEVSARGDLGVYGRKGPFRHTNCRPCPHKAECKFYRDITTDPKFVQLYVNCEDQDGYFRDGCVYREDVNIYDTMVATVSYSNGALMSYSLNASMPIEGYHLAFNGTKGRLEIRDFEKQPWTTPHETEIYLIHNFGKREMIPIAASTAGGHGGGDTRLRDLVFRKPAGVPTHLALPDSRAGAMSCMTGIAARHSVEKGQPVKLSDLITI